MATNVMGTYVNINNGNVNVYKIFLDVVVYMFFHSVIVVISPIAYIVIYIPIIAPINVVMIGSILTSAISPATSAVPFTATLAIDEIIAGIIVIDIS